jgi:hypothetical protein
MVIAVLRALTWGTVAAAVTSAVLLASVNGGAPRIASITGDAARGRLSSSPPAGQVSADGNLQQPAAAGQSRPITR